MKKPVRKDWGKEFWTDLGERVGATFLVTFIPVYETVTNATHLDLLNAVEISGTAAGLTLLKCMLANLLSPSSGPSLLPAPPAPAVAD